MLFLFKMRCLKHVQIATVLVFSFFIARSQALISLQLVESLLKEFNRSTIISAVLCEKNDVFQTVRFFAKQFNQISIYRNTVESLPYLVPTSYIVFVLNLQCPHAENFLLKANEAKLFAAPFKWIIYSNESTFEIITENYLINFDLLVDSDVTLALMQPELNSTFKISKIYKLNSNSTSFILENLGEWSSKNGLILSYERINPKRRKNLMKTSLNTCIVITNNDSLNHLTDKRDRHIDSLAKVDYVLVEHLKDTVNATLNYSIQGTWGYKGKTGWSGMIGELTRNEADIGGTALFLTSDRISIIDYIAMVTPTRSKFIFREPKLSYVSNVFTLPFDRYVWASTWALLVIIASILYVIVKWEWKRQDLNDLEESTGTDQLNSSLEVSFITFGALCQQGSPFTPFSIPGRITMVYLFLSFMFLYTSYSANIVALLQSSSSSIQTLEDVLHSRLELGVDNTVFNHFYFPNATEPIRKAIYSQKVAPPGQKPRFYTLEEGIRKMRGGLFAFHVETGPGYKFISEIFREDEKCGLKEIQYLQVPDPWLAIQKNSSYKKMLKIGLRLLQETGIQNREVNSIYTKKPQCLSSGSSFVSVSLVDCYPAAVILAGGLIAAICVFLFEVYVAKKIIQYKRWRRNRAKTQNIPRK